MSLYHSIDVKAGVIDSDYRGTLKVLLSNQGDSDFIVPIGYRMAQIILLPTYELNFIELSVCSYSV
jgi:dUTP pyrophosphatase